MNLKVIEEKLGYYYVHEINKFIVQDFYEWLFSRTYIKTTVTVVKSLKPIIKDRNLPICKTATACGMSYGTLYVALTVGKTICFETADKLSKYLKVSLENYFDVRRQEKPFSFVANNGVRTLLSVVLAKASSKGLIEHNYALSEHSGKVTGKKNKREIYEGADLEKFMKCVMAEEDIRKKTAFSLLIYMGLRLGELVGLEFKDIDFHKNEIAIRRSTGYVKEFGVFTKEPKTKSSQAVLSVPQDLMDLLAEYKAWWNKQKAIRKAIRWDLWADTDRLFCQDSGKEMTGSTIREWLIKFEQKHNLKHVTPHGLRHTSITFQIDSGIDVKTVSERARHSKVQTTLDIYTHRTNRSDKAAADVINKALRFA